MNTTYRALPHIRGINLKALEMKTLASLMLLTAISLLAGGCSSVISQETLREVKPHITMEMVQMNPENYMGKKVLWGGTILTTENLPEKTRIEVFETELGPSNVPTGENSRGRFIIEANGFLDPIIYSSDKSITVAGTIKEISKERIGSMNYPYPVVIPIEMKVIDDEEVEERFPSTMPPWWYYPYYDPAYHWYTPAPHPGLR